MRIADLHCARDAPHAFPNRTGFTRRVVAPSEPGARRSRSVRGCSPHTHMDRALRADLTELRVPTPWPASGLALARKDRLFPRLSRDAHTLASR